MLRLVSDEQNIYHGLMIIKNKVKLQNLEQCSQVRLDISAMVVYFLIMAIMTSIWIYLLI